MVVAKQVRMFFEPGDVLQLRLVCGLRPGAEPCNGEVLFPVRGAQAPDGLAVSALRRVLDDRVPCGNVGEYATA